MFNILGILLALIISAAGRGQGTIVGWESLVAVGGGIAAVLLFYFSVSAHLVERWQLINLRQRALDADSPQNLRDALREERELMLRRIPVFRLGADMMILSLYLVQVTVFGWSDYVSTVLHVPLYLDVAPMLAPYFLMLGASWVGQYRIDRHIRASGMKPLRFIMFQSRANLMTILPILLIYTAYWAVLEFVPFLRNLLRSFEFLEIGLQLALVICVSFFVPLAIRLILPGGPMPDGRLRRRLETFARDRGLKVSQILVWRTGSRFFATAFVIGLVPPFRYVFFTDTLLKRMNEDEILAVFAHEMGHVHHRHLWWLLAFILSFTIVLIGMTQALQLAGLPFGHADFLIVGLLLAYGYFTFGYVSRRFERQADAFAARHTSAEHISSVLLRLGMENPAARRKHGWRHFSLDRRVREIILQKARPEVAKIFQAELWKGLAFAIAVTLTAAAFLVLPVRDDVVSGLATYSLYQFHEAREADAGQDRLDELRERIIERSRAMAPLRPEYELAAYWYEGQVEVLTGKDTDAFERMAAFAREQAAGAATEEARKAWKEQAVYADASKTAALKARENGTPFDEELDRELIRRGLGG